MRLVGVFALALCAAIISSAASAQSTDTPKLLPGESVVRVQAEGRVERMPDYLGLSVTVRSRGTTPSQVSTDNRAKLAKLVSDLRALGLSEGMIDAEEFEASPIYRDRNGGGDTSEVVGYQARQTIGIEVRDLNRLEPVLERLSELGYSELRASFRLRDLRSAELAAQRDAIANARKEAENLASSLGMRVSRLLLVANDPLGYRGWETLGGDIVITGSRVQPLELKPAPVKVDSKVFVDWSLINR